MVQIPEGYEQTPTYAIKRFDGKYTYLFNSLSDPNASIAVIDDKIMDWTEHFDKQMKAGLISKK